MKYRRFWRNIRKTDDCWYWIGNKSSNGYGRITMDGLTDYAHRWSWRIHFGPIPSGYSVRTHCKNKVCVSPNHLFLQKVALKGK
jgi:aryl-phospho-beta-D-glucosidase BglC (GH1 family)